LPRIDGVLPGADDRGQLVIAGQSAELSENFYAITAPRRHPVPALEKLLAPAG